MLTASWLVRCSQSPSDANIINWSWGCNWCMEIAGSALSIGFLKGSRRRNLAYKGSLLNSAFFKYTSPIDLEICKIDSDNYKSTQKRRCIKPTYTHKKQILYSVIILQSYLAIRYSWVPYISETCIQKLDYIIYIYMARGEWKITCVSFS